VTTPESPSSLLERAADLIENLACGATAGPWRSSPHPSHRDESNVLDSKGSSPFVSACCGGNCYGYVERPEDAAWIATLDPSVAPSLVAWLRRAASYFAPSGPLTDEEADTDPYAGPAMQFARTVLGEETP
jgi:hypothetical protein